MLEYVLIWNTVEVIHTSVLLFIAIEVIWIEEIVLSEIALHVSDIRILARSIRLECRGIPINGFIITTHSECFVELFFFAIYNSNWFLHASDA